MVGEETKDGDLPPIAYQPKGPEVVASVIFFVNPGSGGHQGARLLEELQDTVAQQQGGIVALDEDRAVKLTAFDISLWATTTLETTVTTDADTPLPELQESLLATPATPWIELQEALLVLSDNSDANSFVPSVVVAAGGDGTFKWAVDILRNPQLRQGLQNPQELMSIWPSRFAPLPLGTGNELANVMGWKDILSQPMNCCACRCRRGINNSMIPNLEEYLLELFENQVVRFDEWQVIEQTAPASGLHAPTTQVHSMLCFCSFGMDAKIALQFAQIREEKAAWMTSTVFLNKVIHAWYGFKRIMSSHDSIAQRIQLSVQLNDDDDDNNNNNNNSDPNNKELTPVDIPEGLQNTAIFNISSGADGIDFWGGLQPSLPNEFPTQHHQSSTPSPSDGKLEVCGLRNIFPHMSAVKMQVQHSHRLAQTTMAQIEVLQPVPVEVDGEPWILNEGDKLFIQPRPRTEDEICMDVYVVQGPGPIRHHYSSSSSNQTQTLEHSPSSGSIHRLTLALQHLNLRAKGTFLPSRRRHEEGEGGNSHSDSAPRTTDNSSLFHRSVPT